MLITCSKNSGERAASSLEKGSSQQVLLLVLLLLSAAFAYLYFFTGLIKPREEMTKTSVNQVAQIKNPIPPRAQTYGDKGEGQVKSEATKAASQQKAKSVVPGGENQAKPMQTSQNKAVQPANTESAKNAEPVKKMQTAVAGKSPVKPAPAQAKPVEKKVDKPAASGKPAAKKLVAVSPVKKVVPVAGKPVRGAYQLVLTDDFAASELKAVQANLKKAGIITVEKHKISKAEPMHRLFLDEFDNYAAAVTELKKLLKVAPDAFMVNEKAMYAVYAGSYLRKSKAAIEEDRLSGKGIKLILKPATVSVAVFRLKAGNFAGKSQADKAAKSLVKMGIHNKVVKVGI